MMKIYQKAYKRYQDACENYGIESLSMNLFVKHLTVEQLEEYLKGH